MRIRLGKMSLNLKVSKWYSYTRMFLLHRHEFSREKTGATWFALNLLQYPLPVKASSGLTGHLIQWGLFLNYAEITKKIRKPKPWKHPQPITIGQLRQMRDEFWDTAPHYGGQKGISYRFLSIMCMYIVLLCIILLVDRSFLFLLGCIVLLAAPYAILALTI